MKRLLKKCRVLLIGATGLLFLVSCASTYTYQAHYLDADALVSQRDFIGASKVIEKNKEIVYKEKDRVLYYLDAGMLYHFSGEYEMSNQALSSAEQGIEDLYTKSISKALTSGVLNDNALDYSGEDYEDIYLNIFKALNYIALGDNESALVEIRRVHIKLGILEDKYRELINEYNQSDEAEGEIEARELRFYNSALARYLGMLLYRADGAFDDARIELDEIREAFREQSQLYDFEMPELPEQRGLDGKAHLSVMAFTGFSPRKMAETFYIDTGNNMIYITSVSQNKEYVNEAMGFNFLLMPGVDPGHHFKFQYPRMDLQGSRIDRIVLLVDGASVKELPLFENMESIGQEIFLIKQPLIVGRSLIRTVIKGIAKEAGKEAMKEQMSNDMGGLLMGALIGVAADVAVDATENADLRVSHYFPAYAHALDLPLEPGNHTVQLEYYSGSQMVYRDNIGEVYLEEKGMNFVESFVLE
jgi:tetratricopeptide (TPR) repeat protein